MQDRTTLLVAKDKHLYFFGNLSGIDVIAGNQLLRVPFDSEYWKNKLSRYYQIVFLDYGFEPIMAEIVRPLTQAKLILFFWNHMTEEKILLLRQTQAEQNIDDIYSFDPIEAQEFSLKHNSSFYSKQLTLPDRELKHDLFFGASNNGRMDVAKTVLAILNTLHIDSHYFILKGKGNDQEGYLPYNDYLSLVAQSKGILEIMRSGQTGLTLRTLESLFFKKKLVTTNSKIRYYHFYNPENIFIIGKDDFDDLPDFLNSPYQEQESTETFLDFFSDRQWAQRFYEDNTQIYEEIEYDSELIQHRRQQITVL
ncbi:oligosaccharide biosynthesis protein Alg14 [Enterococcus sp. BWB1-3]|uniref:oligosaccharide biosynthesis protein Alg14 n=1 Tax=unclassified Enterococcus TaxID=2608891 RepID=UPI001924E930|nr:MULTISPECIES: oligosaccharide biosynthesis protein Alg14 [unclassified Enterococcus]MBL1230741.1 oligosaccharide biosynthesis protein Alg14 [Enterococcus sp. BWB1-3]MCB5951053.1 oligosaccharide biosynthesis protein Alg14 [Enterococcus sp. BWT-B8]